MARPLAKAWFVTCDPRNEAQARLARWYAPLEGAYSAAGGWVYSAAGRPVAQGWSAYYARRKREIWDALEERTK